MGYVAGTIMVGILSVFLLMGTSTLGYKSGIDSILEQLRVCKSTKLSIEECDNLFKWEIK